MTQDVTEQLRPTFLELDAIAQDADCSDVLQDFLTDLAEQNAEMFSGQHDANGNAWAQLLPTTVKHKTQSQILVETGALRESLVSVGAPGNISEVTATGVLFGTNIEYAMFHQTGTSHMPARPPMGISEKTLDKLCDRIANATVAKMKG